MFQGHKDFSVYEPAEAALLLGVNSNKIRRWLNGYKYVRDGTQIAQPPLWSPEYVDEEGFYLGFRDLIEIRFVEAFSRAGLNRRSIRHLLVKAKEWIGQDYPLSTSQFQTDGKTLFLEVWEDGEDIDQGRTIDLRDGQHAFRSFVKPSFKDLEFEAGSVSKWYVDGKNNLIAIDPKIAFGQPVVESLGIPTARLHEAFIAEGSLRTVAQQFEVPLSAVQSAVRFEQSLAAKR